MYAKFNPYYHKSVWPFELGRGPVLGECGCLPARRFCRISRCAACALALPMLTVAVPGASRAQERCEPVAARVVSVQGTVELQRAGIARMVGRDARRGTVPRRYGQGGPSQPRCPRARQRFPAQARPGHHACLPEHHRRTSLVARSDLRRRVLFQPSAARARCRYPLRQRRRRGHRVPGPGRGRPGRGGHARRPGAAAESRRASCAWPRAMPLWCWRTRRQRRCSSRARAMPWPGRCTIRRCWRRWPSGARGPAPCRPACRPRSMRWPRTTTRSRSTRSTPCPRPRVTPAIGPTAPGCS